MNVQRYSYVTEYGLVEDPIGEYVKYEDYTWMSDYADRLVEFGKLPCLPKDLENLREANSHFSQENCILQARVRELEAEVRSLKAFQLTDNVQTHVRQNYNQVNCKSNNQIFQ